MTGGRPDVPAYDVVVASVPVTTLQTVTADHVDFNGHVGVRGYFDLHMRACDLWFEQNGMDAAYRGRTDLTLFSMNHRLTYLAELRAGATVSIHVTVTEVRDDRVRGRSIMVDRTSARVCNVLEFLEGSVGLTSRRLEPFAEPLRTNLRRAVRS